MLSTAINNKLRQFRSSTLLVNSVYLMLATIAVAVLGFVFWVIVTRGYSAATVGLAVTLLSVSGLLSLISLVGFDTTLVRFLPKSDHQNDHINSGLIIVAIFSAVLSFGFVLSLPFTSPRLAFVLHNSWYLTAFVFFTATTALNTLTNAIFLAFKNARIIFIINLLFSTLKVALPLLIRHGSAMTIFVLVGISQLAGLVISLIFMCTRLGYTFSPKIHLDILRVTQKYSSSVYVASILNLLPPTLLPLLVVHQLGPENAAYYYMAFTIASALYTISYSAMQSAFAEGSHDEMALKAHIAKAAKLIGVLLVPAVMLTVGLSGFILKIFGGAYAAKGSPLLQLFAVSAFPVAVYSALGAIFKVTQYLRGIVAMNITYAVIIVGGGYLLVPRHGVIAIGWAWALGNIAAAAIGLLCLKRRHRLILI
jgi:O-antigen/teichoic acid export membrane protein